MYRIYHETTFIIMPPKRAAKSLEKPARGSGQNADGQVQDNRKLGIHAIYALLGVQQLVQ